ncbi:MAG: carbohydrate ABC transporter permease [Actinomycetes bacterium]
MSVTAPQGVAAGAGGVRRPGPAGARRSPSQARPLTAYLFLAPYVVLFAVFVLGPVLYGLWISLHNWDFLLPGKPFVGARNYVDLFTEGSVTNGPFWGAMRATGIFMVLSVPLLIVIPLALAVALRPSFRGRSFFRAVIFAPFVLGVAVVGLLWRFLLDPNVGVLDYYLGVLGIDGPAWTSQTPWVWAALVGPTIWWTAGYNTVIFLAGLQDIPAELYEAAEMDGASAWQRFTSVTLPSLRPVLIFVVTITILASANVFGQPYLITEGQPGNETRSLIMLIGEEGLRAFKMGSAAAMSTVMTVALMIVSLLTWLATRERTR